LDAAQPFLPATLARVPLNRAWTHSELAGDRGI
jgi:hypothetical protein